MIKEREYTLRRKNVAKKMQEYSVAVLVSAKPQTRSNDTEYPYRQNSNFYYLTGFREDNAALVIVKKKKSFASYLFLQKKDKALELWTGKRTGTHKAKNIFNHDDVFLIDKFEEKVADFIKLSRNIYFDFTQEDEKITIVKSLGKYFSSYNNIASIVGALRLIKSDAEIKIIRKALSITKEAHHHAIKMSKNLRFEYELQSEIEYIFKKNGSYSDAYTSIVACGNSANTLHYIENNKKLQKDALILIDAGCEYDYYASDITRTIPVSGKFTDPQKELYSMVLEVEDKIIKMIEPGIFRTELQKKSEELLCAGMVNLGILKGSVKKLIKNKKHKKYYPHGIGHWMGLDVHDESPYKTKNAKEIPLKPGMLMTIEPGIYIDENDTSVPKRFRGIGIRIEDDILVTQDGYENLSQGIVKEIEAIESL